MNTKSKDHIENWSPTTDQLNEHNRILALKGGENNIVYSALVKVHNDKNIYVKTGSIRSQRNLITRVKEHLKEFLSFCLFQAVKCIDAEAVESEFKKISIVIMNQRNIKSKNLNQTEITLLSETVTASMLGNLVFLVGKNKILEDNGNVQKKDDIGLQLQKERTRQMEIDLKQKELDLKILQLQYEMKKVPTITCIKPKEKEKETFYSLESKRVKKFLLDNIVVSRNNILHLKDICKLFTGKDINHSSVSNRTRKEIEKLLRESFSDPNYAMKDSTHNGKRFRGWIGYSLTQKN
jgi:hypothetical protein